MKKIIIKLLAHLINPEEIEWIVNDIAELGIKIGNRFFFLYKGRMLEYETLKHDNGFPMYYRKIGKREFGETCRPVKFNEGIIMIPDQYRDGEGWKRCDGKD